MLASGMVPYRQTYDRNTCANRLVRHAAICVACISPYVQALLFFRGDYSMNKIKDKYRNKTIQKLDKQTLDQGLKDQGFHLPFPWHVFSTREVATAIGVSSQTMHNMHLRGYGPLPEPFEHYRGNRLMYRYDRLCAWITGLPLWECQRLWLMEHHKSFPCSNELETYQSIDALIFSTFYKQPKWRRKARAGKITASGVVS